MLSAVGAQRRLRTQHHHIRMNNASVIGDRQPSKELHDICQPHLAALKREVSPRIVAYLTHLADASTSIRSLWVAVAEPSGTSFRLVTLR
jgi:hypothetical protein